MKFFALLGLTLSFLSVARGQDEELVFSDDSSTGSLTSLTVSSSSSSSSTSTTVTRGSQKYSCKCYPGDSCWPSASAWSRFNNTVGGNLQLAIPPGASCYNKVTGAGGPEISTYDGAKCAEVQNNWTKEQWNTDHPISALWTYWTNSTCTPFPSSPSSTCTRGYYGTYVVQAKTRQQVKATVDFARVNNIRLLIRNTGHDFMGRSTGYGTLVLNTHSFKDVTFHKAWTGAGTWRGGAVTVGAGIQGRELWKLANQRNPPQALVTGECPTVGFAGGFIQGGGHGPLSSLYGMAADQALSFDVVTSSGQYFTANAAKNPSLFWALKGGGPSTFAVVLSVTVKTFPDLPSAAATLSINWTHTVDTDLYWKGVDAFHSLANYYVEKSMYVYYELMTLRLHVQPFVGPNMTATQMNETLSPLFQKLNAEGVPYSSSVLEFPTFYDLYIDVFEDENSGQEILSGGRIYTRSDIAANATAINAAQRLAGEQGMFMLGHIVGPGTGAPTVDNAIHPKWREASSFTITTYTVAGNVSLVEKAAAQNVVTNVVGKALREASPNGAAYVNEGDLEEPNWQTEYWGTNYPRLRVLKTIYDPYGIFYARATPGTEDWEVVDQGTRLCKKL